MRSYADVCQKVEQLTLFMEEQTFDTLYCQWEGREIWQWLDKEQTLFAGWMEDSPTARRIFNGKQPVFKSYSDGTVTFQNVVWLERNKDE